MEEFNPIDEYFDVDWLKSNGWTLNGNMCYRHILFESRNNNYDVNLERIEQLLIQYECTPDDYKKIINELKELIELKNIINT